MAQHQDDPARIIAGDEEAERLVPAPASRLVLAQLERAETYGVQVPGDVESVPQRAMLLERLFGIAPGQEQVRSQPVQPHEIRGSKGPRRPPNSGTVAFLAEDGKALFEQLAALRQIGDLDDVRERAVVRGTAALGAVVRFSGELVCLAVVAPGRLHVAQPVGDTREGFERPQAWQDLSPAESDRALTPGLSLAQIAAYLPETPQREQQPRGFGRRPGRYQEFEGGTHVVVLTL